jgi:hypothetical protein
VHTRRIAAHQLVLMQRPPLLPAPTIIITNTRLVNPRLSPALSSTHLSARHPPPNPSTGLIKPFQQAIFPDCFTTFEACTLNEVRRRRQRHTYSSHLCCCRPAAC